jgi:hypothetical protein
MTLLKSVTGYHKIAEQPHYHIHTLWDISNCKVYKTLPDQFRRIKDKITFPTHGQHSVQYILPPHNKTHCITFIYENGVQSKKRKNHEFSLNFLGYPLKEYSNYDQIDQNLQIRTDSDELETFRSSAFLTYQPIGKRLLNDMKYKLQQKKLKDNLYDYLLEYTWNSPQVSFMDPKTLVIYTIKLILQHYKLTDHSYRTTMLKDTAINFLHKQTNLLTEDQIIETFIFPN